MKDQEYDQIIRSLSWSAGPGCHGGCGVDLYIKDGKLEKVEGVEDHPYNMGTLCPRALALKEYVYHKDRITKPLLRTGKRGEDKWKEISWDEAYDYIEQNMRRLADKYGPETMAFIQGTGRDAGGWLCLLAYNYGSPNWIQSLNGNACYHPRLNSMKITMGDYVAPDASQFCDKRYNDENWKLPDVYMVWGQNPVATCNDGNHGHWIIHCAELGSKLIVVDPCYTWLASRAAVWLQLRPGTDGALALGMLNVLINEKLYDKEFVEKWTYGFDKLAERVQQYSPEWAEDVTGVPAEKIREATRLYAEANQAALQWGVPVDMAPEGLTVATAISYLWVLTGNVDNPGGMAIIKNAFGVTPYPMSQDSIMEMYGDAMPPERLAKKIGGDEFPIAKEFHWRAHADKLVEAMDTGKPYPVKGAWIAGTNFLSGAANPKYWMNAFLKNEFNVVVDLFKTPTAMALADILLPAATFPEREGVRAWWTPLCAQRKAITVGDCRSDGQICFDLAKRLNPNFKWDTMEDLFRFWLSKSGVTLEELREKCWISPPDGHPTKPYYRYEKGLLRPDGKPGFNTPTGKIELYSTHFERWGYDPLPSYTEPLYSPRSTPELAKEYPLILNSGSRVVSFFHSEHRQIRSLRNMEPYPMAEMNPETGRQYGVKDGDWIWIENQFGKAKFKARFREGHMKGIVMVQHSWWFPEKGPETLYGAFDANVNLLIPNDVYSKTGYGGSHMKSVLCKIYPSDTGIEGIYEGGEA